LRVAHRALAADGVGQAEARIQRRSCFLAGTDGGEREAQVGPGAAVEEQHPHGAGVRAAVVVEAGAHGHVAHSVAVQVAEARDRAAELVLEVERAGKAALGGADLLV